MTIPHMQQLVIGRLKHIIYSTHPDSNVRETAAVLQLFEWQPNVHPQAHVPVIEPTDRHALIPLPVYLFQVHISSFTDLNGLYSISIA